MTEALVCASKTQSGWAFHFAGDCSNEGEYTGLMDATKQQLAAIKNLSKGLSIALALTGAE